jgi:aspartate/methionine/tyrosine aminotransferase
MSRFAPNGIIALVAEHPRFNLGGSYGPNLLLEELLDTTMLARLEKTALGYGSAAGDAHLRAAIAEPLGVNAGDVVVTAGSLQALFLLAFVLCDRGDEVVLATPAFPPTRGSFEAVGANIRPLQLSFDRGYRLDVDELAPLLSAKTKFVSLASPQNPSGVAVPYDTLREIAALMRQRCPRAFLIVDDVYREAAFGDDPVAPSALGLGSQVITVASLSKCHGAPGVRIGWAIARDTQVREQLVLGKFNTAICSSALDEILALRILEQRERILRDRRAILARCVATTQAFVHENGELIEWIRPDAGAICCVRLRRDRFDDAAVEQFYQRSRAAGILLSNGTWFGEEARFFRLGFAHLPLPELEQAYDALATVLNQTAHVAA